MANLRNASEKKLSQHISLRRSSGAKVGSNVRVTMSGRVTAVNEYEDSDYSISVEASNVEVEPMTMDDADIMARIRPANPTTPTLRVDAGNTGPST